jgi:RsmE family RNA methyltransferase
MLSWGMRIHDLEDIGKMNIVLFEPGEWTQPLASRDPRAVHLLEILKLVPGDRFAAGEIGALVGTLEFTGRTEDTLVFSNPDWTQEPPAPSRVKVLVGTPRPPTARRLLKDLTTLGARELHFAATDLGDKSYLMSTLWKGEYIENLREGAAQTRTTILPKVERHPSLRRALEAAEAETPAGRVWFDEGGPLWDQHQVHSRAAQGGVLWLALGPERGWSAAERALLADRGWSVAGLGPRTLRTETACALTLGIAVLKGW